MSSFEPDPFREEEINPYAAPVAGVGRPGDVPGEAISDAEAIRRAHINHEASVRALGSLHLLGVFFGILIVVGLGFAIASAVDPFQKRVLAIVAGIYVPATILNFFLGLGLRRLQPWARWTDAALVVFSLVIVLISVIVGAATQSVPGQVLGGYAIGSLINVYILYLLLSSKSTMVFSPFYKDVIAQTPDIRYRMSCLVKGLLWFFVLLIAFSVIGGIVGVLMNR